MGILDRFRAKTEKLDIQGEWIKFNNENLEEATYDPTFDHEFSTPYVGTEKLGQSSYTDIKEWSISERKEILIRCHLMWERHPLAKGAIKTIRGFVVSTGLNITYRNDTIKAILEKFRVNNRSKLQMWERQWFEQLLVDGEVFVRIFSNSIRSQFDVVSLKPWLVENIESDPENRNNIVNYFIREEHGSGAPNDTSQVGLLIPIKAEEIVHCYIGALSYDTRGRSELYAIAPWLRAYREWLENRAKIHRYTGFLYHLAIKDATPGQVTSKRSVMRQPPVPPAIYVSSDQETLTEMGGRIDAGRAAEDGRQIKLMSSVSLGLPEYMLSDGYNANLASARSQQLPALRSFLTYQDIYINELWRPLHEKILEMAGIYLDMEVPEQDASGKDTGKMIKAYEAFDITAQPLVDEDPKSLAEALSLHVQNGWSSKETAATKAGYDWTKERELISKEDSEDAENVMVGRKLGNQPPINNPLPTDNTNPDDEEYVNDTAN